MESSCQFTMMLSCVTVWLAIITQCVQERFLCCTLHPPHICESCCPWQCSWAGGGGRFNTKFVQERFLCCTFTLPLVKVVANMRLGGGNDHCCCTSCISFFCFFWHMNPLHWRNTLWNWSISMTANRSYRGLQLLPVQLYPIGIVWFCTPTGTISLWFSVKYYPDRVYIFIVVYLLYIPTGFYRQPDRDYFYTLYIYISRPGLLL